LNVELIRAICFHLFILTFDSHDHCHSPHFVNVRRTTSETATVFLQKVPLPQHGQLVYNKEGHVQAEMYERVRNSSVRAISNPLPPTGTSTGTSTGETKEEFCPSRYCHHHAECTSTFDLYLTWFQRSPPTHSWHCSPLAKYYDPRPIPVVFVIGLPECVRFEKLVRGVFKHIHA
jgi:hypothetical protein